MTDEKNTAVGSIPWDLGRLPDFDYVKFGQVVDKENGRKDLVLSLEGRKTWFRLACPSGGLVLNALRVTDAMAIFEARVFADTGDRNPLASFTATRRADKAKGEAYIRAAQDAALEEALKQAGFCLYIATQAHIARGKAPASQPGQADDGGQPVEPSKAPPSPVQADAAQQEGKDNVPTQTVRQPEPVPGTPSPAPAEPPPQTTPASQPAPVEPQARGTTPPQSAAQPQSGAVPAQGDKDAAPVVDINTRQPVAAGTNEGKAPPEPEPAPATEDGSVPEALAQSAEPAPVAYTPDMPADEIAALMTLEQAQAFVVKSGTCKGWTLAQVAKDRPTSLRWLQSVCPFADNELKAAATLVLRELELAMAG